MDSSASEKKLQWRKVDGVVNLMFCVLLFTQSFFSYGEVQPQAVFQKVKDSLILVQCDNSTGSGFVMKMEDGKNYFITNKHVVKGQKRVAAFLLSGKQLGLGQFYVAKGVDLVRFEIVDKGVKWLEARKGTPNVNESIYVFGNSDGSGVATELTGVINGVGPDKIEVTAPFVRGNSGSAVLDSEGHVVAVATFATLNPNPKDWTKQDTRFKEVRRFALRLNDVVWEGQKYEKFFRICVAELTKQKKNAGVLPECVAKFSNPRLYFMPRGNGGSFRILSDITLSVTSQKKNIKCPVVRICVLVKGLNGKYYMRDCIMDQIGSISNRRRCPPVFSYGNKKCGWIYRISNDCSVYYLEGLSYYQNLFPEGLSRSGIRFFNKTKDADEELFFVSADVCGGKPPKVACFRFECWQNGSLAGEYNSASPSQLNARNIPVDWFIRDKYSHAFDYGRTGGDLSIGGW